MVLRPASIWGNLEVFRFESKLPETPLTSRNVGDSVFAFNDQDFSSRNGLFERVAAWSKRLFLSL